MRETAVALRFVGVSKEYGTGANRVLALDDVTLAIGSGSFTAIMGPSGSGKSTLLHLAGGLDTPSGGRIFLTNTELAGTETERTELRREHVGFVFQQFNLLPALTVLQNVELPMRLAGRTVDRAAANELIERVGLGARVEHRPAQLSGGEQQRLAIARALVMRPDVILADEPTGALDSASARNVLALLRREVSDHGHTVILVTHDLLAAAHADRVVFLADGRLVDRLEAPTVDSVADHTARFANAVHGS